MLQVIPLQNGKYIVETDTDILNVLQEENTLWMTKDEIALLFKINKNDLESIIHKIITQSDFELVSKIKRIYNSDLLEYETYYNLDILLLLGYTLKEFKKTKLPQNIKFNKDTLVYIDYLLFKY